MTAATWRASASAASRRRHGNATTIWSSPGPVRTRTPSRTDEATAIDLVTCAPTRAVNRRRCSLPRAPGPALPARPIAAARRASRGSVARIHPGTASVSFTAGRGK